MRLKVMPPRVQLPQQVEARSSGRSEASPIAAKPGLTCAAGELFDGPVIAHRGTPLDDRHAT